MLIFAMYGVRSVVWGKQRVETINGIITPFSEFSTFVIYYKWKPVWFANEMEWHSDKIPGWYHNNLILFGNVMIEILIFGIHTEFQ